jgi:hypothetical protein
MGLGLLYHYIWSNSKKELVNDFVDRYVFKEAELEESID